MIRYPEQKYVQPISSQIHTEQDSIQAIEHEVAVRCFLTIV
jgi:hypothetical protein